MILIIGFTCPPTIFLKCITRWDKCHYKVRQVSLQSATSVVRKCDKCYYKVRQVSLQSATSVITKCDKCHYKVQQVLLQSATSVITKCNKCYYKVRQVLLQSATSVITKCDKCYYKVRQVLKSATEETSRRSCWCSKPILCSGSWISFLCKRFFCSNKFAEMLAKWAKTLYRTPEERTNFTFL